MKSIASMALVGLLASFAAAPLAADTPERVVRIAELEIHAAHLDAYRVAVKEEMETSVRVEPGVLAIYCVAIKGEPTKLRFFEIYADEAAYRSHLASTHFQKYVKTTKDMIRSRKLIDTDPVQLSARD